MKTLKKFAKTFRDDQSGATAIEYGMLAAILAVGIIVGVTGMGRRTTDVWNVVTTEVGTS